MTQEEEPRLNFHSKFTRAKDSCPIDSLYSLIHGARSASSLELRILTLTERKELLSRKSSVSPHPKRLKGIAKTKQWQPAQAEDDQRKNMEQINQKLKKLRKMERDFHEQMDRREREMKKRKQHREQQKKERQTDKLNLINVEESKEPSASPPRKQSQSPSSPSRKYSKDHQQHSPPHDLDFPDYYRQGPEVKINTDYEASPQVRNEIREMIKMQRMRQRQVQSIDEDDTGKAAASIVLERIDIRAQGLKKHPANESKNLYEVELSRSQSQNTLKQYNFGKEQVAVKEPQLHENHPGVQENQQYVYSPPEKQEQEAYSPVNEIHFDSHLEQYPDEITAPQPATHVAEQPTYWIAPAPVAKQVQSMENVDPLLIDNKMGGEEEGFQEKIVQIEMAESEKYSEEDHSVIQPIKNKTGTEEGSEFKEQFYDRVEPITKKSEQFINSSHFEDQQVYYSQTSPFPNILPHQQTRSIATDSLDFHPLEQESSSLQGEKRLQNKKSSFKKLMAENRANLVPRMAISTILNQKINEALGDIKNQHGQPSVSPPKLQQSIVKLQISQISPPSSKRKVNFKRRIVEQQDKSHSRDSKPIFQRDPSRINQNKKLLVGFFDDN